MVRRDHRQQRHRPRLAGMRPRSGPRPKGIVRRQLLAIGMVALMLAMLVPLVADTAEAADEPWLNGWPYRAAAPINAASGAGTGYQVLFHIYAGAGVNGAETYQGIPATKLYLNNHAKADFSDLRFTASDGVTLLPYWVESSTSAEAVVWVKLAANLNGAGTTVYCYYGNSAAGSQSNGGAVFLLYDHFDGQALDTDRWNVIPGGGALTTANGHFTMTGSSTWPNLISKSTWSNNIALRTSANIGNTGDIRLALSYSDGYGLVEFMSYNGAPRIRWESDGGQIYPISNYPLKTWGTFEIGISGTRADLRYNGVAVSGSPLMPIDNRGQWEIKIMGSGSLSADWMLIRNYVTNEPTHGTPGPESWKQLEFTSKPSVANIIKTVDGRTITASTVAENYSTIVWDMDDNTTYAGVTQVRHDYEGNGTYTVTVTAYDWLGQEASTSTAVQIGENETAPLGPLQLFGIPVLAGMGFILVGAAALGYGRRIVLALVGIAALVIAALLALGVLP